MKIGVPKEIKNNEYRVGLTPNSVRELVKNNHKVFIQKDAGSEIGFSNSEYKEAGALIINTAAKLYECSELIVKVKNLFQKNLIIYIVNIQFSHIYT